MAGLCLPLPTLRRRPRGRQRTARGRCGARNLHRRGLSPHAPRRSPGALQAFSFRESRLSNRLRRPLTRYLLGPSPRRRPPRYERASIRRLEPRYDRFCFSKRILFGRIEREVLYWACARSDAAGQTVRSLVLFVHGLGGSTEATWGDFPKLIEQDSDLAARYDARTFGYSTGMFGPAPSRCRLAPRLWGRKSRRGIRAIRQSRLSHTAKADSSRAGI